MRKPSAATLVALAALFVALGGVGVAATGDNFILGSSNSANKTTALSVGTLPSSSTCPAPCNALQVTDNSTQANAGGLGVVGKSASTPSATIKNSGGAAALSLLVNAGKPPFAVNSSVKVATLNADQLDGLDSTFFLPTTGKAANSDKLDGIDSTGFVQGQGKLLANRLVMSPDVSEPTLLTIPGLGSVRVQCTASGAFVTYINTTGGSVDFFDPNFSGGLVVPPSSGVSLVRGTTFALGTGNSPGPLRTAVVSAFGFKEATTSGLCHFQAQDVLWTGS